MLSQKLHVIVCRHVEAGLQHLVDLHVPATKGVGVDAADCDPWVLGHVGHRDHVGEPSGGADDHAAETIELLVLAEVALHRDELVHAVLVLHLLECGRIREDEVDGLVARGRLVRVELQRDEPRAATVLLNLRGEVRLECRPPPRECQFCVALGHHADHNSVVLELAAKKFDGVDRKCQSHIGLCCDDCQSKKPPETHLGQVLLVRLTTAQSPPFQKDRLLKILCSNGNLARSRQTLYRQGLKCRCLNGGTDAAFRKIWL
mmetsp:Transcript_21351/g.46559  ORF Transcript_21351/g.46559 Transcript_21351/m.46559 type:complete len:260 (-) Transcript_21351:130-909(-)